MKILLVASCMLGMVSATRVYCDIEEAEDSPTISPPISLHVEYNFNCNNDNNHKSEKGSFDFILNQFLPCNGCNTWYGSDGWGYEINPKQDKVTPGEVTFWLKYQGKKCNTHNHGVGKSFTVECNV